MADQGRAEQLLRRLDAERAEAEAQFYKQGDGGNGLFERTVALYDEALDRRARELVVELGLEEPQPDSTERERLAKIMDALAAFWDKQWVPGEGAVSKITADYRAIAAFLRSGSPSLSLAENPKAVEAAALRGAPARSLTAEDVRAMFNEEFDSDEAEYNPERMADFLNARLGAVPPSPTNTQG